MNEEIENRAALREHTQVHPKCVILDRNNDVFLIQASPIGNFQIDGEEYATLIAVTVDLADDDTPSLFAVNLYGPVSEEPGARTPAFPVQVLANR